MPTQITDKVLNGSITDLKGMVEWSMQSFFPSMRGKDLGEPYVKLEVDPKWQQEIDECKEKIDKLERRRVSTWEKETIKSHTQWRDQDQSYLDSTNKKKEKIEAMMDKVQNWTPPTDEHKDFKEFMEKQLGGELDSLNSTIERQESSIEFHNKMIETPDIEYTKEGRYNYLNGRIKDCESYIEEETKLCNVSNTWVKDLMESIEN
jgi:1,4-alpha-glucan branching enzyme